MNTQKNIWGFELNSIMTTTSLETTAFVVYQSIRGSGNSVTKVEKGLSSKGYRVAAGLLVAALSVCSGCTVDQQQTAKAQPASQSTSGYISNDQLEAQYGIRVMLIGVSAAGGIVDFRYKVSDPVKAATLLQDPANTAVLTAVDTGLSLTPTHMGRHHGQMAGKRGAVPFNFYPNVRGAVKHGTLVSVAFGKIKVEPIAAQ